MAEIYDPGRIRTRDLVPPKANTITTELKRILSNAGIVLKMERKPCMKDWSPVTPSFVVARLI